MSREYAWSTRSIIITIVLLGSLVVLIGQRMRRVSDSTHVLTEAEVHRWRSNPSRSQIAYRIRESQCLVGKRREEIVALLGDPNYSRRDPELELGYVVGPYPVDVLIMGIKFEGEVVTEVFIRED